MVEASVEVHIRKEIGIPRDKYRRLAFYPRYSVELVL